MLPGDIPGRWIRTAALERQAFINAVIRLSRADHANRWVSAVNLSANFLGIVRRGKELRVPLSANSKWTVGLHLHDLQRGALVGPDIEICTKGLQRTGLGSYARVLPGLRGD